MAKFLDLPAEIRNTIYDLVLTTPSCMNLTLSRGSDHIDTQVSDRSVTQVNQQIRRETLPMYHGRPKHFIEVCENTYDVRIRRGQLAEALENLDADAVAEVKHVEFQIEFYSALQWHWSTLSVDLEINKFSWHHRDEPSSDIVQRESNMHKMLEGLVKSIPRVEGKPVVTRATILQMHDLCLAQRWVE